MRTYNNSIVIKFDTTATGNAGAGKPVTVYEVGTVTKAELFNSAEQAITNPINADNEGNYSFKVANGIYDIVIDQGLPTQVKIENELITDAAGGGSGSSAIETIELTSGQVLVQFTVNTEGASFYINGTGADNGRILESVNYSYNQSLNQVTLTNSYPSGTYISAIRDTGYINEDYVRYFDELSDAVTSTKLAIGDQISLKERTAGNGGGGMWNVVLASTVTPNTFNIVACTGVPTLALKLITENGKVSTAQLGSNKSSSDYLVLQYAVSNNDWSTFIIENYSPIGGYVYVDRASLIFDGLKQLIDFTGVSNPMLVLGEKANGDPSDSAPVDIQVNNIRALGDKTAGSRVVFFRKASTCIFNNWVAWFLATPFNGDGEVSVGYESLACKFYNMDLRFNTIGFDDSVGSFQASTFYGGRIEANDFEGVRTKTTNLEFNGTIIEGNDVLLSGVSQVLADGGGSLQFSKCYMELKAASTNQAFITVAAGSTKRISILGGDYYGQNTGPETALLVSGANWALGSLTVIGANLNQVNRICDRGGVVGNWHGSFDYWANVPLQNPALTINGASFYDNNRVDGICADRFSARTRMTTPDLQVNQDGSAGISHNTQRFIGRITTSGVGVWHDVVDLSELGGAASTSLSLDMRFLSRTADFYFNVNLVISGTTSIAFNNLNDNNWANSNFQIVGGVLQVDNLPATNRDWNCSISSLKSALS